MPSLPRLKENLLNQIRKRLTYANVMSSLAVFLVLGGATAFAAINIPANSVGTPQLKKNAVKTGKVAFEAIRAGKLSKNAVPTNRLRDNAVSTNKIADASVLTDKLADEAVASGKLAKDSVLTDKLATNAVTTEKIAGESVITGKLANDSVSTTKLADGSVRTDALGVVNRRGTSVDVESEDTALATASCLAGERALGGGGVWSSGINAALAKVLHVVHSFPNSGATSWSTRVYNGSGGTEQFNTYVLCLQAG